MTNLAQDKALLHLGRMIRSSMLNKEDHLVQTIRFGEVGMMADVMET
jgi:hypothetical protein